VRWKLNERAMRAVGLLPAESAVDEHPSVSSRWPGPWHLLVPVDVLTAGMDRQAVIHLIASGQANEPVTDPHLRTWLRERSSSPAPSSDLVPDGDTRRRADAVLTALTMSSKGWGRVEVHSAALWLALCRHRYGLVVDAFSARWERHLLDHWRDRLASAGLRPRTASTAVGLADLPRSVQAYWSGRTPTGEALPWPPPADRPGSSTPARALTPRQARHQAAALLRQVVADASSLRRQARGRAGVPPSLVERVLRRFPAGVPGAGAVPMVGEHVFPSAGRDAVMDVAQALAYQGAGIAPVEAWALEADPARRPTRQALELLAGLNRSLDG